MVYFNLKRSLNYERVENMTLLDRIELNLRVCKENKMYNLGLNRESLEYLFKCQKKLLNIT